MNSSKHAQAPLLAKPLKNFPIALKSKPSEQLNTTHYLAKAFARSLTVSVFPVPAGPSIENLMSFYDTGIPEMKEIVTELIIMLPLKSKYLI